MKPAIKLFVEKYVKEIQSENAAVFLGAGASQAAGYVDWAGLLKPLAQEIDLDINKETDLISVAQYYENQTNDRASINQAILDSLGKDAEPTENHRILANLDIPVYWTTNYDQLIENSLRDAGKLADVKFTVPQLANTRARRQAVVYKMHGDVEHPDKAVLTKDDYEKYFQERGPYIAALSGDLVSRTFVFIGFSFSDPNLDYILSRVRVTFSKDQRRHYAFFKNRTQRPGESEEDYQLAITRQTLMVQDLRRFNIQALMVDEYEEITEALQEIARLYRMKTVFVSSSASDFQPWGEQEIVDFMRKLGSMLVDKSLRISTGLGLGVGNALFTGALEAVYRDYKKQVDEHLLVRPFPQHIEDAKKREDLWDRYRRDFIPAAGIALFLFGNKKVDGKTVMANGVHSEFSIANENGLILLPIGATGSVAAELADQVLEKPDDFQGIHESLIPLIEETRQPVEKLTELLDPIGRMIQAVQGMDK